jgi:hypothetical protein
MMAAQAPARRDDSEHIPDSPPDESQAGGFAEMPS